LLPRNAACKLPIDSFQEAEIGLPVGRDRPRRGERLGQHLYEQKRLEEMMMTAHELRLRIGLSMRDAAAALCERLYEWRLTRGFVEYLAVKIVKRDTLSEIREIRSAPLRKEEDAAHLAFLLESLVTLEKVEAGEMSF